MIFTTVIVVLFGGLTVWLQDKAFIQLKPTIIYGVFALLLFGGLVTGRPTLQLVMEDALPGLTDTKFAAALIQNKLVLDQALAQGGRLDVRR